MTRVPVSTYPATLALLERQIRMLGSGLGTQDAIDAVQQYVTAGIDELERMTAIVRRASLTGWRHYLAEDLLPVCGAAELPPGEYQVTAVEDLVTCVDCLAVLAHRSEHYLQPRLLHSSEQARIHATCTDGSECAAAHRAEHAALAESEHHALQLVRDALERSTQDQPRAVPVAWILEAYEESDAAGWPVEFGDLWGDDETQMKALASDITARGIRSPILLAHDGQVLDGRRRLAVALKQAMATVPVAFGTNPALTVSTTLTPSKSGVCA